MPHIRHLYRVRNVREFERDLDFLLKHFRPVDFHELSNLPESGGKQQGKTPMLLSFDDGLREFHDPIAPVLLRKGVPAICFLNSAFLDNADLFFRYKASLLAEALQGNTNDGLRRKIFGISYAERAELDELAADIGLDFNAFLTAYQPYLSTAKVEELLKQGFHFGAHSVDHPEYRFLSLKEQLRQTAGSVESISNKFGLGYRLFAFPFTDYGVSRSFFDVVLREKKIADFTFGTAGLKKDIYPNHFQRIPLEVEAFSAEETLRREFFYYWLKKPFGKNRIHRI